MRFIAEYALKSRLNAIIATALGAAIPFLFWISAAVVGLITLRKGAKEGSQVLLWGALPAVFWYMQSDLTPLFVMLGVFVMALVLRQSVLWSYALLVGAAIGSLAASTVQWLPPELMVELVNVSKTVISGSAELTAATGENFEQFLLDLFSGVIAAIHVLMMAGSLMLSRYWQASLYNPGGFKQEFHQLRLPVWAGVILGGLIVLGTSITPEAIKWLPSLTLPLVFACIALVHGVVAIKQLSRHWLTAFYLVLFFAGHSLYVLMIFVALLDSSLNLRRRLRQSSDESDAIK